MEERILVKNKKCNAEQGNKKRVYKMLWMKDLEDRCLGTTHKIKYVISTVLAWLYTHFKCVQICYILQCNF